MEKKKEPSPIAAMIRILLENGDFSECLPWCGLLLIGYLVKSVGSAWSTSMSHTATYYTLRDIRKKMLAKLSRVPMGTILDTPSGQYKTTIVDRVEGMEPTLAHLIPEMTANLLVPVAIAVYIFVLDWRMGFAGPFLAALFFVDELAIVGANVKEINGILDSPELNRPEGKTSLSDEKVCLNQVSFSYGNQDEKVLKGVNLTINPGIVTALVGPSGSGKSTIAKLIAGFWDVTEGNITLGGKDIKEIPLDQLNQEIAYVSQDNYLFDRTIRDNIRMGKLNATDAEVEAVAKAAGCDGFIRKLDKGYDTICGEGGGHLSGGEKQRISIARAMLKDAPIIILDEATASVDPENEAELQKAIDALTHNKTIIMIAHRLKTVRNADQILVLNGGKITQRGTHEELSAQSGLYADFIHAREEAASWKLA